MTESTMSVRRLALAVSLLSLLISCRISSTFACNTDKDCEDYPYFYCCGDQCKAKTCDSCTYDSDCPDDETCDPFGEMCTNVCNRDSDCKWDYKCQDYKCILKEEESGFNVGNIFILIIVIVAAIFFGCCCHFISRKRREERMRANMSTVGGQNVAESPRIRLPTVDNSQPPVYMFHLNTQGNNSNATPSRNSTAAPSQPATGTLPEQSEPRNPDPIVDSGPPPYSCVTYNPEEPQSPPPSYEEAVRA